MAGGVVLMIVVVSVVCVCRGVALLLACNVLQLLCRVGCCVCVCVCGSGWLLVVLAHCAGVVGRAWCGWRLGRERRGCCGLGFVVCIVLVVMVVVFVCVALGCVGLCVAVFLVSVVWFRR